MGKIIEGVSKRVKDVLERVKEDKGEIPLFTGEDIRNVYETAYQEGYERRDKEIIEELKELLGLE